MNDPTEGYFSLTITGAAGIEQFAAFCELIRNGMLDAAPFQEQLKKLRTSADALQQATEANRVTKTP